MRQIKRYKLPVAKYMSLHEYEMYSVGNTVHNYITSWYGDLS